MAQTFTLSGGSPTAKVNAYASTSSSSGSVTITITAQGALNYSGSWVQDSGVSAVFSCTGQSTSGHYILFGAGSRFSSTEWQNKSYSFTIPRSTSSKIVTWSVNFYSWYSPSSYYSDSKASFSGSVSIDPLASYTISYNANGGSGAPSNQTKYYGTDITLSSTVPTRTGYNFKGWSTSSTATSATYSAGGKYTSNSNATLYAVWELKTYTVSYNANGGSGAPSNQTKSYGVDLTLSSTVPTRTGYTFQGWATSSTGSVAYAAGSKYTSNSAITLYAVWEIIVYTISYDANTGSGAPASQTKNHGATLTLSSTIPTKEGYEFIGWGTSASATAASYSAGGSFTGNANTTLYAIWSLIVVCSIAYDANGGENAPESQLHEEDTVSTLSSVMPTRDKYSFSGWSLDSSATKATYLSGGKYVNNDFVNGDVITLYAVWTRIYNVNVRVPSGKDIKGIYVKLPQGSGYAPQQLETSSGEQLLDSQGTYIMVRGG